MSTPQEMSHSLSDETLAAFVDGRLAGSAKRAVVEHLATCDECYASWQAAAEFQALEAPANVVKGRFGGRWVPYAVAAALAGIAVTALVVLDPIGPSMRMRRLTAAAEELNKRPAEGRLTGFGYKPKQATLRSDPKDSGVDNPWGVLIVAGDIDKATEKRPTARNLHGRGVAHLLSGNPREAFADLEKALETSTGQTDIHAAIREETDVKLLNDFSVVAARWGVFAGGNDATRLALAAAERARQLDKNSLEAVWNRAVAIEGLTPRDAVKAWQDYLALDPSSKWAKEAREKIARLQGN